MTFDKINNALKFIKSEDSLKDLKKYDKIKIIKVLINKKNILRKPEFIKAHCGGDPLFLISTGCHIKYVPEGTIFCKSLTVLD